MIVCAVVEISNDSSHNHNELFRIVPEPIYRREWIVIDPRGRRIYGPTSVNACAVWRREHEAEIMNRPDLGYSTDIGSPDVII